MNHRRDLFRGFDDFLLSFFSISLPSPSALFEMASSRVRMYAFILVLPLLAFFKGSLAPGMNLAKDLVRLLLGHNRSFSTF
jgi:hypothetical protein